HPPGDQRLMPRWSEWTRGPGGEDRMYEDPQHRPTDQPGARQGDATRLTPRRARLILDWKALQRFSAASDLIAVEALGSPGDPVPYAFRITFRCRGIVAVHGPSRDPVYEDRHILLIDCDQDFPERPPRVVAQTPIWHPD